MFIKNNILGFSKKTLVALAISVFALMLGSGYYFGIFLPQKRIAEQQKQEQQDKIAELERIAKQQKQEQQDKIAGLEAIKNEQQAKLDEQKIIDTEQQKQIEKLKQQQQLQQKMEADKNTSNYLTQDQFYCQSGANAYTKKAYNAYKEMAEEDEDREKTFKKFKIAFDAYHEKCD